MHVSVLACMAKSEQAIALTSDARLHLTLYSPLLAAMCLTHGATLVIAYCMHDAVCRLRYEKLYRRLRLMTLLFAALQGQND